MAAITTVTGNVPVEMATQNALYTIELCDADVPGHEGAAKVSDNLTLHTSFSSNVFGDSDIDTSTIRLQVVFGWHRAMENMKKLAELHWAGMHNC